MILVGRQDSDVVFTHYEGAHVHQKLWVQQTPGNEMESGDQKEALEGDLTVVSQCQHLHQVLEGSLL